MRYVFLTFSFLLFCLTTTVNSQIEEVETNRYDGKICVVCTGVLNYLQKLSEWKKIPLVQIMKQICYIIPNTTIWGDLLQDCIVFEELFGPFIAYLLEEKVYSDAVCREIDMCKGYEHCSLFQPPGVQEEVINEEKSKLVNDYELKMIRNFFEKSINVISNVLNESPYIPPEINDHDGDYFSVYFSKRGYSWRGRECNDQNSDVYPGKKNNPTKDKHIDYNCNGIFGVDKEDDKTFEEKFCGDSDRRGKNEFDWPAHGVYGGFMNDSTGLCPGCVSSIYLHMRKRNRCNHRDYQTLCFNGADSGTAIRIGETLSRNQTDHPVVVFISLIGNDVCDFDPGFDKWTNPEKFYTNTVNHLKYLDTRLPPKSHVVLVGLADGIFLYTYLHNETHPLGVDYATLYDYLNCVKCNPCWAYMNSNKTVRDMGRQRAKELDMEYVKLANELSFKNFDVHFSNFTSNQHRALDIWLETGNLEKDFVEPFDGFHPSQNALILLADLMYEELLEIDPKIFGKVNKHNKDIEKFFGDQGGH